MDSLITAAARALAAGDPLGALNRVALRSDAPALALRGIAMAQLGELATARSLLRRAARRFGAREAVARARCVVAEAEIALAARELRWSSATLESARVTLASHADHANAALAQLIEVRRLLLIGELDPAERILERLASRSLPPALNAARELLRAGIDARQLRAASARAALQRARHSAQRAKIPALAGEVMDAVRALEKPAARLIVQGVPRLLRLEQVETLLASRALVIDACRCKVRVASHAVSFARRPVLLALVRALGEAYPNDVSRAELIARAFRIRSIDETHRVRLRVEIGRLRALLRRLAAVNSTPRGFTLVPAGTREVVVLALPRDEPHAYLLAILGDGELWSTSAIALASGASQRTVQRTLDALAARGKVQSFGRGRTRRWRTAPIADFTTTLLLPVALAAG
jgi:tetratricopeptide (TPR) repeat protein